MIAATYNVSSFFVLAMAECLDVGSILSKHNVTPSMLLSCLNSSDDEYELSFLPGLQVTNSVVLDLYHFMNKHPHCSFYTLRTWLSILLGDSWPSDPPTVIRQFAKVPKYYSIIRKICQVEETTKLADQGVFLG